jgi:hypothetical protein
VIELSEDEIKAVQNMSAEEIADICRSFGIPTEVVRAGDDQRPQRLEDQANSGAE